MGFRGGSEGKESACSAGDLGGSCNSFKVKVFVAQSCPTLVTAWTVARQALLSMEHSRQE